MNPSCLTKSSKVPIQLDLADFTQHRITTRKTAARHMTLQQYPITNPLGVDMSNEEYMATFTRLSKFMGAECARQMVDEMDADRIRANKKEAKRLAEVERIRAIIREEMGK
jgi:hypothetical protein